ncbi:alpha/beta fold hydrolase [Lentzea tibetensis]|uniref:Alpha/beta fold hydrolase n=1 Tax=Lentzea tibetensis TaxID=2591470 RepID=A0A563EM48_9PSEU|nr:alpha/beta fold hydrolase [Lentzea tibetensis]TWP47991.1 alpha/beta fold hydrolase [Lentzea tibetensis]
MDWNLPEEFVTPDGVVRWARLGAGRPVVLLHGTPFSSFVWRAVAEELAGDHQVFVWDMLGYGRSEMRPGQDVSLRAQGRIFTDLLAEWGLRRPHVVAHDFGGAVALRAHLLHGAEYAALALFDPVALSPWGSPFFRLVQEHFAVFERLPGNLHAALVREYVLSASSPGLAPGVLDELVAPWTGVEGQPAFYRQIAQADQRYTDEVQHRYGEIEIPVSVHWGADDEWIPPAKGAELAALLPRSDFHLVPGAGHLVQLDAPGPVLDLVLRFLREAV